MEDLTKFNCKVLRRKGNDILLALLVVGICLSLKVAGQKLAPDNLVSTAQIVVKSCYYPGVNSEKVAWQFFACYDWVPVNLILLLLAC